MINPAEVTDRFACAIAADPHFDAAVVSYVDSMVAWRRGLGGFNKVVSCGARQRIMKSVLRLHYGNATDNPDDGATFERLLALANPSDGEETCGPRVLRTVISLAQRTGHLYVSKGWFDRRLKILRPTEKWIAQEAERHEAALSSLQLLEQDRSRYLTPPRGAGLVARLQIEARVHLALLEQGAEQLDRPAQQLVEIARRQGEPGRAAKEVQVVADVPQPVHLLAHLAAYRRDPLG